MENKLNEKQANIRVIENCLNGRRTAWDDPYKAGRNGLQGVQQVIEMHSPLDLIIIALGTNDFQSMHQLNAWHSAQGLKALIGEIREAPIEPGMSIPPILVVVPPMIETPKGPIAPKFSGGEHKILGLAEEYQLVASELNCHYFDCSSVTSASTVDGIHLDKNQHHIVGGAIADVVSNLI